MNKIGTGNRDRWQTSISCAGKVQQT